MAYIYAQVREGHIPDIYVQNPKYFDNYTNDLRAMWKDNGDIIDMVSIHVRRAGNPSNPDEPNYSDNPFYVDLMQTRYYEHAMALFSNVDFLVFSDDIKWCKKQEIFKKCEFLEGNDELEDFNTMSNCSAHIIANSSFSWWAAFLSGNKTVAPRDYYSDKVERTKYPKEWIIV